MMLLFPTTELEYMNNEVCRGVDEIIHALLITYLYAQYLLFLQQQQSIIEQEKLSLLSQQIKLHENLKIKLFLLLMKLQYWFEVRL